MSNKHGTVLGEYYSDKLLEYVCTLMNSDINKQVYKLCRLAFSVFHYIHTHICNGFTTLKYIKLAIMYVCM